MNTINVLRGQRIRRALLTVARTCFERGVPLPTVNHISKAVGICDEQARRHMRRLIDEGAVSTCMAGKRRHVREIQP